MALADDVVILYIIFLINNWKFNYVEIENFTLNLLGLKIMIPITNVF